MTTPNELLRLRFLDPEGDGVRILSLDGGDILCYSQLLMLEELMHRLGYDHGRSIRPCEFFHSITGVGAAGVIAILLGVLGMTVEDALKAFAGICEKIFAEDVCNETCRSEILTTELERVIDGLHLPSDSLLAGDLARSAGCLVSVCYSAAPTHGCRVFRNYRSRQPSHNPTIVEAARASWATPSLFSSIRIGPLSSPEELISAVNGFNNPTLEAVQEAREIYGTDRAVSTFLSLGSGKRGPVSIHSSDSLQRTAQQTDITEEHIERELGPSSVYYRFSPEHTIRSETFAIESNPLGSITSYTRAYLESMKTSHAMERYLKASAYTSSIDLQFRGQAQGVATRPEPQPNRSQLSDDEEGTLEKLRVAGLESGSPLQGCMEGTREDILERINDWTTDFTAPNILWLKGHPGVGKSAIATEAVERLTAARRLGSCFFFQRQNDALNPYSLWRTVAYDLARTHPTIRRFTMAKLKAGEVSPTSRILDRLFLHFVHEALMGSVGIPDARLPVVVIDALDECGGLEGQNSEHRRSLMKNLQNWSRLPAKLKLIVTSRGENDIERLFSTTKHYPIEILAGQTVDAQSSEDIRMFLTDQFQRATLRYPSLPHNWPGVENIQQLVDKAAGLFIWAQTAIKFVESGEPQGRLSYILKGGVSGDIDSLYKKVLETSFHGLKAEELNEFNDFRSVVGTIILAKAPLSLSFLPPLLAVERSKVEHICTGLQSVLEYRNILRFHHQSFVDFLLKGGVCPPEFFIERKRENRKVTLACLRVMREELRFNLCGIESSYFRNTDTPALAARANEKILPHLIYSSCWWASHLEETAFDDELMEHIWEFMRDQFLWWLEVLSITKRVNLASRMLLSLVDWIRPHRQDGTMAMARDMQKFVAVFAGVISQSAAHIYLSALPFSPQSSAVSKQYTPEYLQTLVISNGGLSTWPAIQNVLTEHTRTVYSVAFSPDGRRVVSGSSDETVRIWDAETGETVIGPLQGHSDIVSSVAFSPDGRRVVSGSWDQTVRIWDAETGETVIGPLQGHSNVVSSVAFSPDGRRVVSGSSDDTVRIWDAETGETVIGPLQGHSNVVSSVAFSPDGRRVVSGSWDQTVRIWDAETGETVIGPLQGHSDIVSSVAFSPDGRRVVSGSWDETVRIWDAETGETVIGPLQGHSDIVSSVAFSPDGRRVVSGSWDQTVRIWDAETGETVIGPLQGHSDIVSSVAFSPDGRRVVSGSWDETVRIWDAETGETVIGPLQGHSSYVNSVAFSPDGGRVVSGSSDETVRIWDAETGETVIGPLQGHSNVVSSVAFSPDGRRVVSGSWDQTVRIWDAETGETVIGPLQGHSDIVSSVAFSPDGRRVVSGSWDQTVRIWDAETGETVIGPLQGHSDIVSSVAFSPDGRRVVSGSWDQTVRIWDAETGETVIGPLQGHSDIVSSVAFSPDGRRVVSGSWDETVRIWDAETGETVIGPLQGHSDIVSSVAFSPDGRRVVSGSYDQTVRIWDAETGETVIGPLQGHSNYVNSVAFSPDGRRVVSGSWDQTVRIWDAETGETVIGPLQGHSDIVSSVAFSPDGRRVVSGSYDRTVRIWDAETGETVIGPLQGHSDIVSSVAFSPDGRRVVSGSYDRTVRIWDAETGETVIGPLQGHSDIVSSVAFSPDGRRVVSGSWDETVRIWDAETGETVIGPLQGHSNYVNSVAFSPDGRRVVSGSWDQTVRIWDAETGETVIGLLQGHSNYVNSVAFSPDGRRVVSGSSDLTVRIWDAETGETVIGPLQGHSNVVKSVAFSPDGRRVVSGSYDQTVRIWDAETGETVIGPFQGHSSGVKSVAFSPDGRRVVSGSYDQTVRIWDAETGETVIGPLQGHSSSVDSVAFSPDGRRVVSGSSGHTVRIWDAETGEPVIGPLQGHSSVVKSVAFSPDGRRVVSGSSDETVRIWDAETGETVIGPLQGHSSGVSSVAFWQDGRCVVSGSYDQTTRILDSGVQYSKNLDRSFSSFSDHTHVEDGWVLGPNSELLFWVPPKLRVGLWRPRNTLLIGKVVQTRLDLNSFVHGNSWTLCKTRSNPGCEGIAVGGPLATPVFSPKSRDSSVSMQIVGSNSGHSSGRTKRKASRNLAGASGIGGITRKKAWLEGNAAN